MNIFTRIKIWYKKQKLKDISIVVLDMVENYKINKDCFSIKYYGDFLDIFLIKIKNVYFLYNTKTFNIQYITNFDSIESVVHVDSTVSIIGNGIVDIFSEKEKRYLNYNIFYPLYKQYLKDEKIKYKKRKEQYKNEILREIIKQNMEI